MGRKLRELKKDTNVLLFHTNMEAGHSGASGRFEALKEVAEEYAFILDLEGIKWSIKKNNYICKVVLISICFHVD